MGGAAPPGSGPVSPRAVAPRVPGLEDEEVQLAQDQAEYLETPALPVAFSDGSMGILTRWRFSPEELALLAGGADLFLLTMTFGKPFQPVLLTAGMPDWAVGHGPTQEQQEENDRVRANRERRKAEEAKILDDLKPGGLPLLEALTGGDLLLLSTAQLAELSADYVRRRNLELGADLVADVDEVRAGSDGLDVRVTWRNLEERASPDGSGYPPVHQATGALSTRCGLFGKTTAGDLKPTDRAVTCQRCNPPRWP